MITQTSLNIMNTFIYNKENFLREASINVGSGNSIRSHQFATVLNRINLENDGHRLWPRHGEDAGEGTRWEKSRKVTAFPSRAREAIVADEGTFLADTKPDLMIRVKSRRGGILSSGSVITVPDLRVKRRDGARGNCARGSLRPAASYFVRIRDARNSNGKIR